MKRLLTIITLIVVVLGITAYIVVSDSFSQKALTIEGNHIGEFPICGPESQIEISPGFTFKLSTTSSVSRVTQSTLEWLRSRGCVVDSSYRFMIGNDDAEGMKFSTSIYRVNLPITSYRFYFDSIAGRMAWKHAPASSPSYINNVDVVVTSPEEGNTLGVDFLRQFVMEYNHANSSITFHNEMPAGYELLGTFRASHRLKDLLSVNPRYFVDIKVDHEPYAFLMNTGMNGIALKLPVERLATSENVRSPYEEIIYLAGKRYEATVDQSAWIEMGNRAGSRRIHLFRGKDAEFEINPLVFFDQDMVIDFKNHSMYLRPYYKIEDLTS